jgi:(S)-2-hydroxyglutarate dehydrogenase
VVVLSDRTFDVAVIGGGIVGLATARALSAIPDLSIVLLEAEDRLAAHQTGHNSGVIHSGLYYKPGSLKARNCAEGREALYRYCAERGIPHDRCGKVVVATRPEEMPLFDALERRGLANGLQGLKRLTPEEICEREPHTNGLAGLLVPDTGIVDYTTVSESYAGDLRRAGGRIETAARLSAVEQRGEEWVLTTSRGDARCRNLVACAGLHADRVARTCGLDPGVRIVPFRGEYYALRAEREHLVRNLIYPVPDPRFPFLGVHLTRMIAGGIEAGPNAVLAWKREGYTKWSFSARDALEWLAYPGFWRMGAHHWQRGWVEAWRSLSKHAFVKALQKLLPELREGDIRPAGAGVRAQALAPDGKLVDDFHLVEAERMIHVLNAPSPAATASLAIGDTIAQRAIERFGLRAPVH